MLRQRFHWSSFVLGEGRIGLGDITVCAATADEAREKIKAAFDKWYDGAFDYTKPLESDSDYDEAMVQYNDDKSEFRTKLWHEIETAPRGYQESDVQFMFGASL